LYGNDQVQGYEQGGIPIGGPQGQILAQEHYSPQGAITDPFGTAANMVLPQVLPIAQALGGANCCVANVVPSSKRLRRRHGDAIRGPGRDCVPAGTDEKVALSGRPQGV
jgi:hypothetical protein